MLVSLEVQGLRGIKQGRVDGLAPLTIFVGPNGCGKSTMLEAAGVACAGDSAAAAFEAIAAREWLGLSGLDHWITGKDGLKVETTLDAPISYLHRSVSEFTSMLRVSPRAESEAKEPVRALQLTSGHQVILNEDGVATFHVDRAPLLPFALNTVLPDRPAGAHKRFTSPRFSSHARDALTAIKLSPSYDDLLEYLQVLRPDLVSIESIAVGERDEPFMFEKNPRRGYPIAYAGDGFRRSLLLAATLARGKGGVAALDEPEAFAHPRMFTLLAKLFRKAIANQTQIMVATHSLEFVRDCLSELQGEPESVCVIGLTMADGVLDPLLVTGADAFRRVVEWKDDLRL